MEVVLHRQNNAIGMNELERSKKKRYKKITLNKASLYKSPYGSYARLHSAQGCAIHQSLLMLMSHQWMLCIGYTIWAAHISLRSPWPFVRRRFALILCKVPDKLHFAVNCRLHFRRIPDFRKKNNFFCFDPEMHTHTHTRSRSGVAEHITPKRQKKTRQQPSNILISHTECDGMPLENQNWIQCRPKCFR